LELFDIAASFPIIHVHRNQCTPIRIVKKKRREWWIKKLDESYFSYYYKNDEISVKIRITPPEKPYEWRYVKEVKKKQGVWE
jgi:hypothetical protein